MTALLAGLYLLPLIPIYTELAASYSFGITLICLAMLKYELHRQSVLKQFSSIEVNKIGTWHLLNWQGKRQIITFKNFICCGVVLFLLFTLNGKRQRVIVFAKQQEPSHWHKLKVYLRNL